MMTRRTHLTVRVTNLCQWDESSDLPWLRHNSVSSTFSLLACFLVHGACTMPPWQEGGGVSTFSLLACFLVHGACTMPPWQEEGGGGKHVQPAGLLLGPWGMHDAALAGGGGRGKHVQPAGLLLGSWGMHDAALAGGWGGPHLPRAHSPPPTSGQD